MMKPSSLIEKKHCLKRALEQYGSLLVAFSGGVDSSFLLSYAVEILGQHVVAVTADSPLHPNREKAEAARYARKLGVRYVVVKTNELESPDFTANPVNRCYICKKNLFERFLQIAASMGIQYVAHGANVDDLSDFRPGHAATRELGIVAPLIDAGLTKADIRELSKQMHLETWNKPSMACLASRIPYGNRITRQALEMIDSAENYLLDSGLRTCRVRHHGDLARIEVSPDDVERMVTGNVRREIVQRFREIGYLYVTLDLEGYSQGSMNRAVCVDEHSLVPGLRSKGPESGNEE